MTVNNKRQEVTKMKKAGMLVVFVMCAFTLVLCGRMAEAQTIELKFAQPFSPRHTMQVQVFEPWAEKINKETNGRVKVTFFPGGALGRTPDHYDLAETGIADISYTLHDYTPGRFPLTEAFSLPFMTPTALQASRAMWKTYEKFPEFRKEYDRVKVLALFCHPGGHFHTVRRPIRSIEDFRGLKMRTANPFVTEALRTFGSVPVTTPVTETYTALERGVVDGTVVPWEGLGIFNLDDLTKYSTITHLYTMVMMVVMNLDKWNSLPEDVKEVIEANSGMVLSEWAGRVYDETDEPFRNRALDKGTEILEFSTSDMEKLRAMTLPLREQWVDSMEARGLPGRAVLDAALKFLEED